MQILYFESIGFMNRDNDDRDFVENCLCIPAIT